MNALPITVSLWYTDGDALPNLNPGINQSIVKTLGPNGEVETTNPPTTGAWTELKTTYGQTLTATIATEVEVTGYSDYTFSGYYRDDFAASDSATFFAIVIGTAPMANLDTVHFNSVSLCQGHIPTRPAPQTADEVLRECQYFYEKSYDNAILPGTATYLNRIQMPQLLYYNGAAFELCPGPITFTYNTVKRAVPYIELYSPDGSNQTGKVLGLIYLGNPVTNANGSTVIGNWDQTYKGTKAVVYSPANTNTYVTSTALAATARVSGAVCFQYVIEARLGII